MQRSAVSAINSSERERPELPEVHSPTVRRRELGALLRALRAEQGLTVEQVAERLVCSPSKVSRMETGSRGATLRDIRDLCDLYSVTDPAERERMTKLVVEGKQQGWWKSYELDDFATYVGFEAEAVVVKDYQSILIPGLLQTPDYARAANEVVVPEPASKRLDEWTEVRLRRQRRLTQEPLLSFRVVLDEAALRRVVGGPGVMGAQLEHLIEAASLPNVTLQIIPYDVGAYPGMDTTFNIVEFAGPVPGVVYVEGLLGWQYVKNQQKISRYQQVFDQLCSVALNPQESIGLVTRIRTKIKRAEVL
jgi:transcriptional regulator with XRE-family HTH domain